MTKCSSLRISLIAGLTASVCHLAGAQGTLANGNVAYHFHNAFAAAGTEHFELYNMICPRIEDSNAGKIATPPDARSASIEQAVPKQVLDNLYYVGDYARWESSASAWIVDTGEGLVLIDALYPDSYEVIEKGIKDLGLDIQDLKYLVVGHGHADHYGGARYFQDTYGVEVMMSELEWEFLSTQDGDAFTKPLKDGVIEDGQVWTVGNTTFQFYVTPGHTPGTVSTIFNSTDRGVPHKVAQWGGTGFDFAAAEAAEKISWFEIYAESVRRFQGLIRDNEADVLIVNHCVLDNTYAKFDAMNDANATSPNPWVIGVNWTANYTQVAESCARAGIAAYA